MTQNTSQGLAVVQRQIAELEALKRQTLQDLNTVAGSERLAQWKLKTVALLMEAVGRQEGQRFAAIQPGPSFTNDLVEEFTDLVDCYHAPLAALARQLAQSSRPGS